MMKGLAKYFGLSALTVAIYTPVFALQQKHSAEDYTLVAMKDCQVVSKTQMTGQQLDAYLALQDQEELMETVSGSLESIEALLEQHADEIERLAELAFEEDDQIIRINKAYLEQQREASSALQSFIGEHQPMFDAVENAGERIRLAAETFEASIERTLDDVEFDQLRVLGPDSTQTAIGCTVKL